MLRELNDAVPTVLAFERTAGDEFQGVLAEPDEVVDVVLRLVRPGGLEHRRGCRPGADAAAAEHPRRRGPGLPERPAGRRRGEAAAARLAVRGAVPADAGDAQAVLSALAVLVDRRSEQAWEAINLVGGGRTQAEAAAPSGSPGRRSASGWPPGCGSSSGTPPHRRPVADPGGGVRPA